MADPDQSESKVFRRALKKIRESDWSALKRAARIRGLPAPVLAIDVLRRKRSLQWIRFQEYFELGLHRPEMSDAVRDQYVGEFCGQRFNSALVDPGTFGVFKSKIASGILLERVGLPTPPILAIAAAAPMRAAWPVLSTETALEQFLLAPSNLPVFGKPVDAKSSLGALSLVESVGEADIRLGDGRILPARTIARAILSQFPKGYLLQSMIRPHPDMLALTGPASATVRVVTVWGKNGPMHLYTCLKLPAKGAMADGDESGEVATAAVDADTGRVLRAQRGGVWAGENLDTSPATGAPLAGAQLPDFALAQQLAMDAHCCFPQQGLVGADIALTDKGPVAVELNCHPGHKLYQRAFDLPFLGDEIAGKMREALACAGVDPVARRLPIR